ncbi:hypothetical protein HDU76_006502 [Blyttiomyces sp. JEL0837]|nr:hypothetical protein HDU76_006502 [Blyttiomyces sp. JEL0837]
MVLLSNVFRDAGMEEVSYIIKARVPICKFYDSEFGLHADVNTHNLLGLENTKLIHTYLQMDKRLELVIRLVKFWAKQRGLNDAATMRTISSYAYTLMVINFFQVKGLLPSLQAMSHGPNKMCQEKERDNRTFKELNAESQRYMDNLRSKNRGISSSSSRQIEVVSGPVGIPQAHLQTVPSHWSSVSSTCNVSFDDLSCYCGAVQRIVSKSSDKTYAQIVKESIGLFYDVMRYYGCEYEYSTNRVISIRTGTVLQNLTAHLLNSKQNRGCYLVVEDPFQVCILVFYGFFEKMFIFRAGLGFFINTLYSWSSSEITYNTKNSLIETSRHIQQEFLRAVNILSDVASKGSR